ncbi:hypothetical protein H6F42_03355 [Pseudanabaena sp. FACHB-1998]|nr:hypothetical protein [Pseudanabaena sp. FACHB-1998]
MKAKRVEHLRFEMIGEEYQNIGANALPLQVCFCKLLRARIDPDNNVQGGRCLP